MVSCNYCIPISSKYYDLNYLNLVHQFFRICYLFDVHLKVTLPYLIAACKFDEEIVIVDGGSTDGPAEYLKGLKDFIEM